MDDIEKTVRDTEATIERVAALLRQGGEVLARSEALAAGGATPTLAQDFLARQPEDVRAQAAREVEELHTELERDLPKQVATRQARIRPGRSMV